VAHKKLAPITKEMVQAGFKGDVIVVNETSEVLQFINEIDWHDSVLLMMSSGNFDGIDYDQLGKEIINQL
jgi:UDP-N-acetylmuramate: L-alanyl-gamma-D-glutamyl-meso-diaminopimelate ligase